MPTIGTSEPKAAYGHAWMRQAVSARKAADRLRAGARDELRSYLDGPLEMTADVIGWWGVSKPLESFHM
jgi:hypothetical protein